MTERDMPKIKKNGPCQADRRNHDRIGFYHKVIWAYFGTKNSNIRVFLKRDMPKIKKKNPARQTGGTMTESLKRDVPKVKKKPLPGGPEES